MSNIIMPCFRRCPEEAAVIGRILAGYGELELEMTHCLALSVGSLREAINIIYKKRLGEKNRIYSAFDIMKESYGKLGLYLELEEAKNSILWCRDARNVFAHCHWLDHNGFLFYVHLESVAKSRIEHSQIIPKKIDIDTLNRVEEYFHHSLSWFWFLGHEYNLKTGAIKSHPFPIPNKIEPPPLQSHLPRSERPPLVPL